MIDYSITLITQLLDRCGKSGWPVCDAKCEKAIARNPEVVVPHQTGSKCEDSYNYSYFNVNSYNFQREGLKLSLSMDLAIFMIA